MNWGDGGMGGGGAILQHNTIKQLDDGFFLKLQVAMKISNKS